jgi:periplasmic protein TonB
MRALAGNIAIAQSVPSSIVLEEPRHQAIDARFDMLERASAPPGARGRSRPLTASLLVHGTLVALALLLPLLWDAPLPSTPDALRAFFVAPEPAPPPPPPPPPPRASLRQAPTAPVPFPQTSHAFVAPIEVPEEIKPNAGIDLGIEGGVPGGVEGGVPGGVAGGVVGGLLPAPMPSPPTTVVRVGGAIKAPKLVHSVAPEFPLLAAQARVSGLVIVEANVDKQGRVIDVRVLRGHPLLDAAALTAVRQWRYQPLLLNGIPMEFVLTLTVQFTLTQGPAS